MPARLEDIILGSIAWRFGDDYGHKFALDNSDRILKYAYSLYMHLDGRAFALSNLMQNHLLKFATPAIACLLWVGGFIILVYNLTYILQIKLKSPLIANRLFIFILITALMWIGMIRHLETTLYWITGDYYSFNAAVFSVWYLYYSGTLKSLNKRVAHFSLSLFLTFLASNSMPNLSIGIISLLIFDLVVVFIKQKRQIKKIYKFIPYYIGAIAGFLVLACAPGNNGRISRYGDTGYELNPVNLLHNFFDLSVQYLNHANLLIFFSIIVASIVVFSDRFKIHNLTSKLFEPEYFKWLIAAFATIVPMTLYPRLARIRTEIYFDVFITIFTFLFFAKVFFYVKNQVSFKFVKKLYSEIVSYAFLVLFNFMVYQHIEKSLIIKKRNEYIGYAG